MPIKIKKFDIEHDTEIPKPDYLFLGFDENGELVQKDEYGTYKKVVSSISGTTFDSIITPYLTVGGTRVSGYPWGNYTIAQGTSNICVGDTSFVRGRFSQTYGKYSFASGEYVSASGTSSYAWGNGLNPSLMLISNGINSFVHQYCITDTAGSLSDYSVILGGYDNDIGSGSECSVILGGYNNIIPNDKDNVVYIGRTDFTSPTYQNTVYVSKLSLDTSVPDFTTGNTIEYNGLIWYDNTGSHNIYAIVNGEKKTLVQASGNFVYTDTDQRITGKKTFGNGVNSNYAIYVDSYNTISGQANFVGNWESSGYWGIGSLPGGTNTVKIGAVSPPTSGTWWGPANLIIDGKMGIKSVSTPINNDLQIGTLSSIQTATPNVLSLGGTFSSTHGTNAKLKIYDDGSSYYGFGVSSGQLDIITSTNDSICFYTNNTIRMAVNSNSILATDLSLSVRSINCYNNAYFYATVNSEHINTNTIACNSLTNLKVTGNVYILNKTPNTLTSVENIMNNSYFYYGTLNNINTDKIVYITCYSLGGNAAYAYKYQNVNIRAYNTPYDWIDLFSNEYPIAGYNVYPNINLFTTPFYYTVLFPKGYSQLFIRLFAGTGNTNDSYVITKVTYFILGGNV